MSTAETIPTIDLEEEPSIDLRKYLGLLLQWWWLIILATLLAAVAAYFYSRTITPIYQATTTVLINQAPSESHTTDYNTIITSERLAQTYAEMMTKRPVVEEVIKRLGLSLTPESLIAAINVTPVRDTQLLNISVKSPDPRLAADAANMVVAVFSDQLQETQTSRFTASKQSLQNQMADAEKQMADIRQQMANAKEPTEMARLESRLNQYEQIYSKLVLSFEQVRLTEAQAVSNVVQVEKAEIPDGPVSPKKMQNTLLAAVVGLMLAVGGVFAFDALDDTIKTPEDITRRYKLPVMGIIARFEDKGGELITRDQPRSPVTESFRALRTNVQYAAVDKPLRTLLITSPAPSDGKTSITSNLAVVLAQSGKRITVLDADLHRPRVHQVFKTELQPGMSSLFVQPQVYLNGSLQSTSTERLKMVSAGKLPPNPSELLGSNKMREIMDVVLAQSDMVLLDTPPVLSVTDAVVLAPIVDGVLLVIRPGKTRMSAFRSAVEQLRYVGGRVIGVVLNDVEARRPRYGYYYKNYYYHQYKDYGRSQYGSNAKRNEKVNNRVVVIPTDQGRGIKP